MATEWMSAAEAAASLHITRATLYKLVHEGRIPAHRQHGRWVFLPCEIEALFAVTADVSGSSDPDAQGATP